MVRSVTVLVATLVAAAVQGQGVEPVASPFEHGGAEVDTARAPTVVAGQAPILYRRAFEAERDLFGYRPRFLPGEIAFAPDNRPFIKTTILARTAQFRTVATDPKEVFIQTLDAHGRWVVYPLHEIVERKRPGQSRKIASSVWSGDTRVVFDRAGDGYTLVSAGPYYLLHYRATTGEWDVYDIPLGGRPLLEPSDRYGNQSVPPLILSGYGGRLATLGKKPDGTLAISAALRYGPDSAFLNPGHSGAGPASVTLGRTTFLLFGDTAPLPRTVAVPPVLAAMHRLVPQPLRWQEPDGVYPGTPQFCAALDRDTGTISPPVLLGFAHNVYEPKPDDHNGPAVVADSRGLLHVVFGAHQFPFFYTRSTVPVPRTAADWTPPQPLGRMRHNDCGLTYTALVIDRDDTLHLVARNMSRGLDADGTVLPEKECNNEAMTRSLDYFRARRQPDGTWRWEERGPLVIPLWHRAYSIFYHRLTLDNRGRLFLSYYYYATQLSPEEETAYRTAWPEEIDADGKVTPQAHDPALLVSVDGGETWRLALTADLTPP